MPLITTSHRGSSAFNLSPYQGDEGNIKPVINYSYDNEDLTPYSYKVFFWMNSKQVYHLACRVNQRCMKLILKRKMRFFLIVNSRNGNMNWDGTALSGYQLIENNTKIYLYMIPEELPEYVSVLEGGDLSNKISTEGKKCLFGFKISKRHEKNFLFRYGISFIDEDQAKSNYKKEKFKEKQSPRYKSTARQIWNKALNKIEVSGGSKADKNTFFILPCIELMSVLYVSRKMVGIIVRLMAKFIMTEVDRFYTDDWIWDSYRAHHPL